MFHKYEVYVNGTLAAKVGSMHEAEKLFHRFPNARVEVFKIIVHTECLLIRRRDAGQCETACQTF